MKRLEIVILLVIAVGLILNVFKSTSVTVEGYSKEEVNYLLEIQSLKQEKNRLLNHVTTLENEIKRDSIYIHTSTRSERDSLRSILNPR